MQLHSFPMSQASFISSMNFPMAARDPSRVVPLTQESSCCELSRIDGGVYILNLAGDSSNLLSPETILSIDKLLDLILRDDEARVLIMTNQGKFFSNGMDVNYLKCSSRERALEYLQTFQRLVCKLLTFCLPTIAVIRGHAVGAGCVFALAHDYRLMSSERGYIFMNEVDLGMSLVPGIMALLRAKLPVSTFQEAILTGKRYDGKGAFKDGIVQATCPGGAVLLQEGIRKAMEYKARDWRRDIYRALKMEIFKKALQELENGGTGHARL